MTTLWERADHSVYAVISQLDFEGRILVLIVPVHIHGILLLTRQVVNKGYFSEAFLFKPRGGRSPPSGLNRKPRKYPLFCL